MTFSVKKLFTEHPKTQGETYLQHAFFASCLGTKMLCSGACMFLHAALPFICPPKPFDLKSMAKYINNKNDYREENKTPDR